MLTTSAVVDARQKVKNHNVKFSFVAKGLLTLKTVLTPYHFKHLTNSIRFQ